MIRASRFSISLLGLALVTTLLTSPAEARSRSRSGSGFGRILSGAAVGVVGGVAAGAAVNAAARTFEQRQGASSPAGTVLVPGRDAPLAPNAADGFAACPQLFPERRPLDLTKLDPKWRAVALCSNHFAVVYSASSKTPVVVVERLNKALLADAHGEERTNDFYADPRLAVGARAELVDFRQAGPDGRRFDRGHLANAADQPDRESMIQSFALSNMVPQDPVNNRQGGSWFKAEQDTRKYARRADGDVFVFSGPLFRGTVQTLGPNQVWIPSHLFKLVVDATTKRSWAYIVSNTAEVQLAPPVDYAEFVRQTGWQFLGPVTSTAR